MVCLAAECGTMLALEAQGCDAEDAVVALANLISAESHKSEDPGRGTRIAPGHDSVPRRVAYRPSWRDHFRFHWAAVPESHMTVLREDWKKFLQGRPGDAFFPLHQKSIFINIRARL